MNVFGYLRVSSSGQVDGDGFDRQRAAITAFCEKKGWRVIKWYEEPVSGTVDGMERPKFAEMVASCGPGTAEIVVVEAAHRLARDLMVSELLISEANKRSIKIFEAAAEQDLTSSADPTRVLLRQFLGAISQWDKTNTVLRLRAARERAKAAGKRHVGVEPWEDKHPVLAEHIISLRKTGYSLAEIQKFLIEHRYKTPSGQKHTMWKRSTISQMIQRLIDKKKLPPLEKKTVVLPELGIEL